jgi:hypothetical protein
MSLFCGFTSMGVMCGVWRNSRVDVDIRSRQSGGRAVHEWTLALSNLVEILGTVLDATASFPNQSFSPALTVPARTCFPHD